MDGQPPAAAYVRRRRPVEYHLAQGRQDHSTGPMRHTFYAGRRSKQARFGPGRRRAALAGATVCAIRLSAQHPQMYGDYILLTHWPPPDRQA